MASFCRVMGFVTLVVLLVACHAETSVEAPGVALPSTTTITTTTTTTSTTVEDDSDVVDVSEKETVVASTDMPTAVNNATSLPPSAENKGADEKLPSPSLTPSAVGDKEKEVEDREDKEDKEDKGDKEETDKEKTEKGEPLEVDDMLKDPYRNDTIEDSTTAHADKDTVTVVDSHVVDSKKTHEEEAANNETANTEPPPTRITDQPVSQVFVTESTLATGVMALVVDHSNHDHLSLGKTSPFSQPTATAAILAGVLVAVAVAGYVGLVTWRKFLEKRYGNREMLVNEDDDMHHFEL